MKIHYSVRKIFLIAAVIVLTAFAAGCKQGADAKKEAQGAGSAPPVQPPQPAAIVLKVELYNGETEDIQSVIPPSGIPYTINSYFTYIKKLRASAKDTALDGKRIEAEVTLPASNPPVTLTREPADSNSFKINFSSVTAPTPVKVRFWIDEPKTEYTYAFTLLPQPLVTGIENIPSDLKLKKDQTFKLQPKLITEPKMIGRWPAENFIDGVYKRFSYKSDTESVASVSKDNPHQYFSSGTITAKTAGTAKITVKVNDKVQTVNVTVTDTGKPAPSALTLSESAVNLKPGESKEITVTPEPSDGDTELTDWENSSPSVGKIEKTADGKYRVTALGTGTAVFTAKSKANSTIELKITLTVSTELVASVNVEPATVTLGKGETRRLTATVLPSGAPAAVRWESSKPDTVSVDGNGNITALKSGGDAVITAVSAADSSKKGSANVTIQAVFSSFTMGLSENTIWYGKDSELTIRPYPENTAGNFEVTADNPDLKITQVPGNPNKFTVSVKNKNAETKLLSNITVKAKAKPELPAQTAEISINTIVPKFLKLNGPDKMYKDEEIAITVSTNMTYPETADASVDWEVRGVGLSAIPPRAISVTEDGKVTVNSIYKDSIQNGTKIRLTAKSKLKPSVQAEKEITVYDNITEIQSVSIDKAECELGDHGSYPSLTVQLKTGGSIHKKFAICSYKNSHPVADDVFFEKAVFDSSDYSASSDYELNPKQNTIGVKHKFYVYPIDPKTGNPISKGEDKTFELTIWEKPTGVKILKPDQSECDKDSDGKYILKIKRNSQQTNWTVKMTPEYAKQYEFEYKIDGNKNKDGNYYTYLTDWAGAPWGGNSFTVNTRDIGFLYGDRENTVTFTSKPNKKFTVKLYVTVMKN